MLRSNQKASRFALRMILGLPALKARRDMLRLFYVGILLSKALSTWPRHCFESPPSSVNRVCGISQSHWITHFDRLIADSEELATAYQVMVGRLGSDGVLPNLVSDPGQDYPVRPVSTWRSAVRSFVNCRELDRFQQESRSHPTLAVLAAATRKSLNERLSVVTCSPSHANWIRIRLLCGTSALNTTMGRITRSARSRLCPMCEEVEESVQHFLRDCMDPSYVEARANHEVNMPRFFAALSPLQQCAFILGCSVSVPSDPPKAHTADRGEDSINIKLVQELYGHRSRKLQDTLGLIVPEDIDMTLDAPPAVLPAASMLSAPSPLLIWLRGAAKVRPSLGEGVEAHGVHAKPRI